MSNDLHLNFPSSSSYLIHIFLFLVDPAPTPLTPWLIKFQLFSKNLGKKLNFDDFLSLSGTFLVQNRTARTLRKVPTLSDLWKKFQAIPFFFFVFLDPGKAKNWHYKALTHQETCSLPRFLTFSDQKRGKYRGKTPETFRKHFCVTKK